MRLRIKWGLGREAERWLIENVGERLYCLHNQQGGHEWRFGIDAERNSVLEIDDDRAATMFILKFGEKIYESSRR